MHENLRTKGPARGTRKTDKSEPHDGSAHTRVRDGRTITFRNYARQHHFAREKVVEQTMQIWVEMHMRNYFRP